MPFRIAGPRLQDRACLQRQVEHQHFGVVAVFQGQLGFVTDLQRVTGFQGDAVDLQLATRHLHIGATAVAERMVQLLAAIKNGGEDAGILVDAQRALGTVRRSDQAQLAALAVRREVGPS